MPTERPRRIQVNFEAVDPSLRLLGYDGDQAVSLQIEESVRILADLILRAGAEVEKILAPEEWNLIADVLNGCLDLQLYTGSTISASNLLTSNVADGIRLDGLAEKWLDDDAEGKAMLRKLGKLSELQCQAVCAAVRFFWATEEAPEDWWAVKHRAPARKGK